MLPEVFQETDGLSHPGCPEAFGNLGLVRDGLGHDPVVDPGSRVPVRQGREHIGLLEDPAPLSHIVGGVQDGVEHDGIALLVHQLPVIAEETGELPEVHLHRRLVREKTAAGGNDFAINLVRLRRVLEEIIIDGIRTNAHLMYLLTYQAEFIKGGYDTSYWGRVEKDLETELSKVDKAG